MKKIVMTAAMVACAAVVTAQTVTSANIVGYAKEAIPAGGLTMKSAQFSGADGGVTLDNAFSGLDYTAQVIVWSGGGYLTYTFYGVDNGWLDASFQPAGDVVIPAGSGVWLQSAGAALDAITSGEVPDVASVDVPVTVGLNMISNPYPVALALGDIPAGLTYLDTAIVWTGGGYLTYTYYGEANGWLDASFQPADTVEIAVGEACWLSAQTAATLTFVKAY